MAIVYIMILPLMQNMLAYMASRRYSAYMTSEDGPALHSLTTAWFTQKFGSPTPIQKETWQAMGAGHHILAVAPTGSGKTLAAFLVALDRLFTNRLDSDGMRVLYISPLKALGADIRENLTTPLRELRAAFQQQGNGKVMELRVGIRNGDTTPSERRRQIEHPPQILISTPESLNILLLSEGGRSLLSTTRICIVDEIHAIASSRRGSLLACAMERLTDLAGDVQRVGLSATVKPVELAAAFLGGYTLVGESLQPRPVRILSPPSAKSIRITLEKLPRPENKDRPESDAFWLDIAKRLKESIRLRRSTLIFIDSRKWSEKVARLINENEAEILTWAHHGSLSKDMRRLVEGRLKEGRLKAVVATASLELGIDIGVLDEVVLLGCPDAPSTVLQRAGRAGHRPNQVSKARIFPITKGDLLAGTVMAHMASNGEIEELRIPENPLDVLAQVILSCCTEKGRSVTELWNLLKRAWCFNNLPKETFDTVLAMLRGRYAQTRIAALKPRIYKDGDKLVARPGTQMLLYFGGGAIPDLGMYAVREQGEKGSMGSLDEKFVWESQVGAVFHLGNRRWRIVEINDREVIVAPTEENETTEPFWRGEAGSREGEFSLKIANLLSDVEALLSEKNADLKGYLRSQWNLEAEPAAELAEYLEKQRHRAGGTLPHRHQLLIEVAIDSEVGADPSLRTLFVHTFRGGRVNRPLALALQSAWEERSRTPLIPTVSDDTLAFTLRDSDVNDFIHLLYSLTNPQGLIRRVLEATPFFGGRFREVAGRSLLLPSSTPRRRIPLWITRQRSRILLESIASYSDFPLISEVWRSILKDEFDMAALDRLLWEIREGEVAVKVTRTSTPSPFARSVLQRRLMRGMTANQQDQSDARFVSNLDSIEIQRLVQAGTLRPRIPLRLVERLDRRRRRVEPGYAPGSIKALKAWIAEREAFDEEDWKDTLRAVSLEMGWSIAKLEKEVSDDISVCRFGPFGATWYVSAERVVEWKEGFGKDPDWMLGASKLAFWLAGRASVGLNRLALLFGLMGNLPRAETPPETSLPPTILPLLDNLEKTANPHLIIDHISEGTEQAEICDSEGFEILLRWRRRASRQSNRPLPVEKLAAFLAIHQSLTARHIAEDAVHTVLATLEAYPANASLWETAILPARIAHYRPLDLDELVNREDLLWVGAGKHQIVLLTAEGGWRYPPPSFLKSTEHEHAFPGPRDAAAGFWDIAERLGTDSAAATRIIWNRVWEGRLTCHDMAVLRRATLSGFKLMTTTNHRGVGKRPIGGLKGWQGSRPLEGRWYAPAYAEEPDDPLIGERLIRERIRLLLGRYGILSRPLLEKEIPPYRWPMLSRTLSLMELADELVGGRWFDGLPMPQFMAPESLRTWREGASPETGWCIDATDPASLCGIVLDTTLPPRREGTWMVWDDRGVLVFHLQPGQGKLQFPEDIYKELKRGNSQRWRKTVDALDRLAALLLERAVSPLKRLLIKSINEQVVEDARWKKLLEGAGFSPANADNWIRRPRPIGGM